jgi:hypothetical protein
MPMSHPAGALSAPRFVSVIKHRRRFGRFGITFGEMPSTLAPGSRVA